MTGKEVKQLRERYPRIETAHDLQMLLEDLASKYTFNRLQAVRRGDQWVLQGEFATLVAGIDIYTRSNHLRSNLENIVVSYVGRVHDEEVRVRIRREMLSFLESRGFPHAQVIFTVLANNNKIVYKLDIDKNFPCRIAAVKFPFLLPVDVKFPSLVGELCDRKLINKSLERFSKQLKNAGFLGVRLSFSALQYSSNYRANVMIEGKLGERIRYVFLDEDGEKLSSFLLDNLGIDVSILGREALVTRLAKKLRRKGYVLAQVVAKDVKVEDNRTNYIYTVAKGDIFRLRAMQINGLRHIDRDKALSILDIDGFDQDKIKASIARLTSFYVENGFWQVSISNPTYQHDLQAKATDITINVNEDKKLLYVDTEVLGNKFFSNDKIASWLLVSVDKPLVRQQLADFEQKLLSQYQQQGFMYATVSISVDLAAREEHVLDATVKVEIEENKRVRFGSVQIVGLRKTKRSVIERELRFAYGDWYDRDKLLASEQALESLGLFWLVDIRPTSSLFRLNKLEYINFQVRLRESEHGYAAFGPGYSLRRGLRYSGEVGHSNLWGTDRKITLFASISEEKQQRQVNNSSLLGSHFRITYHEPHLAGLPLLGILSYNQKNEAEYYHRSRQSLTGTVVYPLTLQSKISFFYEQRANRIEGTVEQESSLITSEDIQIGEAGVRFSYDSRDSISWATSGMVFELGLSWARKEFFSDVDYFKISALNNYFFNFSRDLVLAMSVSHTAFMQVRSKNTDDILHASERLMTGGSDSVRGFAAAHNLGPYVRYFVSDRNLFIKEVTGGTRRSLMKFEIRYQFVKNFLAVSLFLDSGNTYFSKHEEKRYQDILDRESEKNKRPRSLLFDNFAYELVDIFTQPSILFDSHYYSHGVALNYLSPIGMVNVAFGLPLRQPISASCDVLPHNCFDRSSKEEQWYKRGKLHFNVGAKF